MEMLTRDPGAGLAEQMLCGQQSYSSFFPLKLNPGDKCDVPDFGEFELESM